MSTGGFGVSATVYKMTLAKEERSQIEVDELKDPGMTRGTLLVTISIVLTSLRYISYLWSP